MVLNLMVALLILADLIPRLGHPFGSFLVEWYDRGGYWIVDKNTPPWWGAIRIGSLRAGDVLVAVNQRAFDANHSSIYEQAYAHGDATADLTVERDGQYITLSVPIRLFRLADLLDIKTTEFINGFCYWLLGLMVFIARPKDATNRIAAITANLMAASQWFRHHTPYGATEPIHAIAEVTWTLMVAFIGPTIVHFAMLISKPVAGPADDARVQSVPWWLSGLYIIAALDAIPFAMLKAFMWTRPEAYTPAIVGLSNVMFNALYIGAYCVGFVYAISRWVWVLLHTHSPRQRRQMSILLFGLLVTSIAFYSEMTYMPGVHTNASYFYVDGLDIRFLQLGIPLAVAYIIMRYQTFRSSSPYFTFVVAIASGSLFASIGAWVMRNAVPDAEIFTVPPFIPMVVIAVVTSVLWGNRRLLSRIVGRLVQWEVSSFDSLHRFSLKLVQHTGSADLATQITGALVDELKLEQAAIYNWDVGRQCFTLMAQTPAMAERVDMLMPIGALRHPLRLESNIQDIPPWLEPLRAISYEAVAPLDAPAIDSEGKDERVGLLVLGKRWDEEIFNERDIELIVLISQQVALFLLAARQIDELRQVPQRVIEAQEHERAHLASELHDTIQQFLGGLPLMLESARKKIRNDAQDADVILRDCELEAEHAAKTIRQIRANLSPIQMETSLIRPLNELVRQFELRNGIRIQLACSSDVDGKLSDPARFELFRVVQQALDNIVAHAQALRVTISLQCADERISFAITDDGVGFTNADREAAARGGHYGLISMHGRVTALGGELQITSTPGSGTSVSGWVPAHMID
jgi:signal transduction histidine kinase